jgi:acetyl-CoA synthetase
MSAPADIAIGSAGEIVWRPDPARVAAANVTRLASSAGLDVAQLRERSLDAEWFWDAVVRDLGIAFDRPYEHVRELAEHPADTRWFVGGTLNLATTCVDRHADADPDGVALLWETESGHRRELTRGALREQVDAAARALRALDVEALDRVGLYLPLCPEAVITLYACAKLGAIAVPIFSGFAAEAIATRLLDGGVKVLVTADVAERGGRVVAMKQIADEAAALAGTLEHMLVVRRAPSAPEVPVPWTDGRDVGWERAVVPSESPLVGVSLPPDHPLLLVYTSGSTGKPKGAVLTHAGMAVSIGRDAAYHLDLTRADTLCWITDIGWIMGAWSIVAAGVTGARLCLCEGAATSPGVERLWDLVERNAISALGVSPSLVRAIAAKNEPVPAAKLASLRVLGATGEPMNPEAYRWLSHELGGDRLPIVNISGGTEIGGALLAPLPTQELSSCSLGGPALGMDLVVLDEDGAEVEPGVVGELAVRAPWPGMTQGLWNDRERFIATYWSRHEHVWVHGDWAHVAHDGQWFLHGRSDDTLNIAGQRIGPSEVEGALIDTGLVADAAAIGVPPHPRGEAMWALGGRAPGAGRPDPVELSEAVGARVGKPFRPERIVAVADLPRTRTGKILRRVIRATALGTDPGDLSSLEDVASIAAIREGLA